MAKVGSKESFQEGSKTLKEFSEIIVGAKDIERISESIGNEIIDLSETEKEDVLATLNLFNAEKTIPIMYVSIDGTGIPVTKKEVANRKGKQEDGSAKTREAKLGCIFTQVCTDKKGFPIRDAGSTSYIGSIETAEEFAKKLEIESLKRGINNAEKVVFLGDGAKWIWGIAETYFHNTTHILDFYHAKEHLTDLIDTVCKINKKTNRLDSYTNRLCKFLEKGRIEKIIRFAERLNPNNEKEISKKVAYFSENIEKMRYEDFRKQGFFIGSGVIEAGCKTVVGKRFKQSGMFWSVKGANKLLALRCNLLSNNRFEDFWDKRSVA